MFIFNGLFWVGSAQNVFSLFFGIPLFDESEAKVGFEMTNHSLIKWRKLIN